MNLHPKMKEDHFHENILFYECPEAIILIGLLHFLAL